MHPLITLTGIGKTYQEPGTDHTLALQNINLTFQEGEFFVFVGPSGCGKSTLLRIISGLDTQTHGHVEYGKTLTHRDLSFVFQHFALLPWLTVARNIEIGLIGKGTPEDERQQIVTHELKRFGLEKFSASHPHELSGGMRQRVGLARAFATKPKVMFMDEPFSELDSFTAEELRQELLDLWRETKTTIIMVTHIVAEALELADRVAVMTPRPGKIEKIFEVTLPRPREKRSSEFFKLEDEVTGWIR